MGGVLRQQAGRVAPAGLRSARVCAAAKRAAPQAGQPRHQRRHGGLRAKREGLPNPHRRRQSHRGGRRRFRRDKRRSAAVGARQRGAQGARARCGGQRRRWEQRRGQRRRCGRRLRLQRERQRCRPRGAFAAVPHSAPAPARRMVGRTAGAAGDGGWRLRPDKRGGGASVGRRAALAAGHGRRDRVAGGQRHVDAGGGAARRAGRTRQVGVQDQAQRGRKRGALQSTPGGKGLPAAGGQRERVVTTSPRSSLQ